MVTELWFKIGHIYSNIVPTDAVWKLRQEKYRVLQENHKGSVITEVKERKRTCTTSQLQVQVENQTFGKVRVQVFLLEPRLHSLLDLTLYLVLIPQASKSPQANEMLMKLEHICLSEH